MAWVIAAAVAARGRWRTAWARTLAILSWTTIVILVLMTHVGLLSPLPDPWLMLQFSYRLETFALFGICGAVIAGLALLGGTHRLLVALLLPIVALSVVGAMRQVREVPLIATERGPDMSRSSTFSVGDFADASLRRLPLPTGAKLAIFDRVDVRQRRLETTVSALPGDVIYTDLMTLPQMVDVEGARVVGRWPAPPRSGGWQLRWYLALRIDDDAVPGNAHIVVTEARSLPIVGGRIISILGLLGLAANAAVIAQAAVRRRREAAT
jgi:hypothetical protein